jgi:hypothetical protein
MPATPAANWRIQPRPQLLRLQSRSSQRLSVAHQTEATQSADFRKRADKANGDADRRDLEPLLYDVR